MVTRISNATMVSLTSGQANTATRLKTAAAAALISNPVDNPDFSPAPTITQSSTHDASLTTVVDPRVNPELFRTTPGIFHVLPSTGFVYVGGSTSAPNLGNLQSASVGVLSPVQSNSENMNCAIHEFTVTTAQVIELKLRVTVSNVPYRIIIDGSFLNRDGLANTSPFVKLDFGSTGTHTIGLEAQDIAAVLQGIAASAGSVISAPTSPFIKGMFLGDSITEGIVSGDPIVYVYDRWSGTAAKQLGINGAQNAGVGLTGYTNAGGGRSKLVNQLPYLWQNGVVFDTIGVAMGVNDFDHGFPNATVAADALAAWKNIRTNQPAAYIFVLGIWGEAFGPSATLLSLENALADQFDLWGDPFSSFIRVSTDPAGPWIYGTGYIGHTNGSGNSDIYVSSDGLHQSRAGGVFSGGKVNTAVRAKLLSF